MMVLPAGKGAGLVILAKSMRQVMFPFLGDGLRLIHLLHLDAQAHAWFATGIRHRAGYPKEAFGTTLAELTLGQPPRPPCRSAISHCHGDNSTSASPSRFTSLLWGPPLWKGSRTTRAGEGEARQLASSAALGRKLVRSSQVGPLLRAAGDVSVI